MSGSITLVQTTDRNINQLQQSISQAVNPLLNNPYLNGSLVSVNLVVGSNVINHGLNRVQQGWSQADVTGIADLYRSQPFNSQNLTLVSAVACSAIIYCF